MFLVFVTPRAATLSDPPTFKTTTGAPLIARASFIDLASLERHSDLRRPFSKYQANVREDIKREYIRLGACHPKLHKNQYQPTEFRN